MSEIVKKCLIVSPSLSIGGAEKQLVILANSLSEQYGSIDFLTLVAARHEFSSMLGPKVNKISLKKSRFLFSIPSLIQIILRNKYNVVVSSAPHVSYILGILKLFGLIQELIIREPAPMSAVAKTMRFEKIRNFAHSMLYNKADIVIAPTQIIKNDLLRTYNLSEQKVVIIENSFFLVDEIRIKNSKRDLDKKKKVIFCGRLSEEKGYSILLGVCKNIEKLDIEFTIFCGSGEKDKIEVLRKIAIKQNFELVIGEVDHKKIYAGADIIIMPSRFEGYPNTLFEATYYGLHAVCTPFARDIQSKFISEGTISVCEDFSYDAFFKKLVIACNQKSKFKISDVAVRAFTDNSNAYKKIIENL